MKLCAATIILECCLIKRKYGGLLYVFTSQEVQETSKKRKIVYSKSLRKLQNSLSDSNSQPVVRSWFILLRPADYREFKSNILKEAMR